jgi:hypothetical protein
LLGSVLARVRAVAEHFGAEYRAVELAVFVLLNSDLERLLPMLIFVQRLFGFSAEIAGPGGLPREVADDWELFFCAMTKTVQTDKALVEDIARAVARK